VNGQRHSCKELRRASCRRQRADAITTQ